MADQDARMVGLDIPMHQALPPPASIPYSHVIIYPLRLELTQSKFSGTSCPDNSVVIK